MKKRLISAVLIALFIAVLALPGLLCFKSVTKKTITVYDGEESNKQELDCLFLSNMPHIPYVEVEQYLELLFNDVDFVMTENGECFSYHGEIDDITGSTMTIDTAKDTVTFEDPYNFLIEDINEVGTGYAVIYDDITEESGVQVCNFSDYDIDLIADSRKAFLPFSTLSDIFNSSYFWMNYVDGSFYLARTSGLDYESDFISAKEEEYFQNAERPSDTAEYAYRELCFQIDNLYSSPEQTLSVELADRIREKGLDKALEEGGVFNDINLTDIKRYLRSTSIAEYGAGLMMLNILLWDGGHTQMAAPFLSQLWFDSEHDQEQTAFVAEYNKLCEKDKTVAGLLDVLLPLATKDDDFGWELSERRAEGFGEPAKAWTEYGGDWEFAKLYMFDNTAVFRFDDFDTCLITYEYGAPFSEALKYAKEKGCENFIFDVSTNEGGIIQVMLYMLNVMLGNESVAYYSDVKTGLKYKDICYADKNLDGAVDEKDDAIRYDFHYAVMISRYSYSAANVFPYHAKNAGIPLLGGRSGGGTGTLQIFGLPGASNSYSLSGCLINANSDYESIDAGIEPDYPMLEVDDDLHIISAPLYDPEAIVAIMDQHYK